MIDNNIIWHNYTIGQQAREKKNGHRSALLWFTGLSGSGKSTIAEFLEKKLYSMGIHTYLLDGDNLRHGLCSDLNFSKEHRQENIRRIGEVAKLMIDAGLIVLAPIISPYLKERNKIRNLLDVGYFIEIFIDTPLYICESRDPKGLYKKARAGLINNFTGIDSCYEIPVSPEIHINGIQSINKSIDQVVCFLLNQKIIDNK